MSIHESEKNVTRTDNPITLLAAELEAAKTGTPSECMKRAISAYNSAKTLQGEFEKMADAAKAIIAEIIEETGQEKWFVEGVGRAARTEPQQRGSYDTKALDALVASNDEYERLLMPHRKFTNIPASIRITSK